MDSFELAVGDALAMPVPRAAFFDELLIALREIWEVPVAAQAAQPAGHGHWVRAGSVAAATAGAVGAGAAWYGFKRRHRRSGVA